jgi:hypothetical protein
MNISAWQLENIRIAKYTTAKYRFLPQEIPNAARHKTKRASAIDAAARN